LTEQAETEEKKAEKSTETAQNNPEQQKTESTEIKPEEKKAETKEKS